MVSSLNHAFNIGYLRSPFDGLSVTNVIFYEFVK